MKKTHILTGLAVVALMAVLIAKGPLTAGAMTTSPQWGNPDMDADATLSLSTGLDNSLFMANSDAVSGYYYAEVNATSRTRTDSDRLPLNLSLVIDRSGSMAGDKLRYAKEAALHLVEQLQPEDYVSIVIYDTQVQTLATSNRVGDKELLRNRIRSILNGGGTNLHGGMMEGYAQVSSTFKEGYVNRVLLLSDGLANVGISDTPSLLGIARDKLRQLRISISTFGVGLDFNENLMTGLAENGGGNYYFIHNPGEIPSIFKKELKEMGQVVAQETVLRIQIPQGLFVSRVYGSDYTLNGQELLVRMGDMVAGSKKAVLVRFSSTSGTGLIGYYQDRMATSTFRAYPSASPTRNPQTGYSFHAELTYLDALAPDHGKRSTASDNRLAATNSPDEMVKTMSQRVQEQVVLYESNDRMEAAMRAVDAGKYEEARKLVQDNDAYLNQNIGLVTGNVELQSQMHNNTSYGSQILNAEQVGSEELKYIQKQNKSDNYNLRNRK